MKNNTVFAKARILAADLKYVSARRLRRILSSPQKLLSYSTAFIGYDMHTVSRAFGDRAPAAAAGQALVVFGDFAELHDRIAGQEGSWKALIKKIQARSAGEQALSLKVGVSRYNFARLEKILQACLPLLGGKAGLTTAPLDLFPVKDLARNFAVYLKRLQDAAAAGGLPVEIFLYDGQLTDILNTISLHAGVNPGREKDLLRLLGIISEQVFIGPQAIVFDPFHRCNAKCQHCWVHTPSVQHPEEFLNRKFDFEIFKKVIDDASEMMSDGIILQGDGEPLMYDKFMPMLRYAKSKKLGVLFFTNGILLDEEKAKEIIDLGVNEIYCSFPAGTPATYEKVSSVQPADTFYKIRDNLARFMRLRRTAQRDNPRLVISHVIHTLNYHELVDMATMDADICPDAVRFYLIRLDVMNRFLQLKPGEIEAIKRQIPEVSGILKKKNIEFVDNFEFQLNHYDERTGAWSKDFFLKHGCTIGWYFNLIPAKYDMSFCCHLRTVGHLNRKPYREIWNSVEYWRWRRQGKYLSRNQTVQFINGQVLYDEHCDHCDNHQTILKTFDDLKKYGLYNYY